MGADYVRDRIYICIFILIIFYRHYVVVQSQTVRHHFAAVTVLVEF